MERAVSKFNIRYRIAENEENHQFRKLHEYFKSFVIDIVNGHNIQTDIVLHKLDQGSKNVLDLHFKTSKNICGIEMNPLLIPNLSDIYSMRVFKHMGEIKLSNVIYTHSNSTVELDVILQTEEFFIIEHYNGKFLLAEMSEISKSEANEEIDTFTIIDSVDLSITSHKKL